MSQPNVCKGLCEVGSVEDRRSWTPLWQMTEPYEPSNLRHLHVSVNAIGLIGFDMLSDILQPPGHSAFCTSRLAAGHPTLQDRKFWRLSPVQLRSVPGDGTGRSATSQVGRICAMRRSLTNLQVSWNVDKWPGIRSMDRILAWHPGSDRDVSRR